MDWNNQKTKNIIDNKSKVIKSIKVFQAFFLYINKWYTHLLFLAFNNL